MDLNWSTEQWQPYDSSCEEKRPRIPSREKAKTNYCNRIVNI